MVRVRASQSFGRLLRYHSGNQAEPRKADKGEDTSSSELNLF